MKAKGIKEGVKAVQLSLFDSICNVNVALPDVIKLMPSEQHICPLKTPDASSLHASNPVFNGLVVSYVRDINLGQVESSKCDEKSDLITFLLRNTPSF